MDSVPPALDSVAASPTATEVESPGGPVKRIGAWLALLLAVALAGIGLVVGIEQLGLNRTPVEGTVVSRQPVRYKNQTERCRLKVRYVHHDQEYEYERNAEAYCSTFPDEGQPIKLSVPDNGDQDAIEFQGQEAHDKVGGYIATVVIPLCPLLAIGLPALLYLRKDAGRRRAART